MIEVCNYDVHSNIYTFYTTESIKSFGFVWFSFIAYPYLPNPPVRAWYDTRSIFKRSLTGLNSEFSFSQTSCLPETEEPSLFYYLPTAGGRIIGFIPFPRVLMRCEMQSVSSRIWTRAAVSISYDDNQSYGISTTVVYLMPNSILYT